MMRMSAKAAQEDFSNVLKRVARDHEHVVFCQRGKDVAVLIPVEDAAHYRELSEEEEDRIDNEIADKVLAEMEAKGEKPIPFEVAKARLLQCRKTKGKKRMLHALSPQTGERGMTRRKL
ncbi:MAG: type II toxin-antitoxin system Phd/YefM family antitoxin [Candidatus Sumerlaeota bacterium]|nr:type II toxin-antitoxin system Phd/YefM family antitoxin [Candidatus Sumerlaeota bacterium]